MTSAAPLPLLELLGDQRVTEDELRRRFYAEEVRQVVERIMAVPQKREPDLKQAGNRAMQTLELVTAEVILKLTGKNNPVQTAEMAQRFVRRLTMTLGAMLSEGDPK